MTFAHIAQQFADAQSGSDSFKQLYESAFELMQEDAENAGLYFVVGIAAQTYVVKHEDQAVAPDFADRAKASMERFNSRVAAALAMPATERLRALGDIAIDYQWHEDAF